ncbi:MAG: hypothetical protein ABI662_00265 [Dermatophilaceae bacterium]
MERFDEDRAVEEVHRRLVARFPDLDQAMLRFEVDQAHQSFEGSPIRSFLPILIERAVGERLRAASGSAISAPASLAAS